MTRRRKGRVPLPSEDELREAMELLDPPGPDPIDVISILDDVEPVEKAAPEPPEVVIEAEATPTSGALVMRWKRAIVQRDAQGLIVGILGDGFSKTVKRDDEGRITEIIEESEEELGA